MQICHCHFPQPRCILGLRHQIYTQGGSSTSLHFNATSNNSTWDKSVPCREPASDSLAPPLEALASSWFHVSSFPFFFGHLQDSPWQPDSVDLSLKWAEAQPGNPWGHSRKWPFQLIPFIPFKCGPSTLRKLKLPCFWSVTSGWRLKFSTTDSSKIILSRFEIWRLCRSFVSICRPSKHRRETCGKRRFIVLFSI